MKKTLFFTIALICIIAACKETIIESTIPKEFTNDLLHSDLVGRVMQKPANAMAIVSQVVAVDSAAIDPADGSFAFRDLRAGNYVLTIRANKYRIFSKEMDLHGGGIAYAGDITLSTIPEPVNNIYPANGDEIVYDWRYGRIVISVMFDKDMDRASVENAFSTIPASDGIFTWGQYTQSPQSSIFTADKNAGYDPGATITTYSKVRSFTYSMAMKDSYVDSAYTCILSTEAKDTGGAHLRFPLTCTFRTVQSYTSIRGIQTSPMNGDINVDPLSSSGIQVVFPRRMDPVSTETAVNVTPAMTKMLLWPSGNEMHLYTGGTLLSDTTITVSIDSTAKDKDGVPLGKTYVFSFHTAAFAPKYTSPSNAQLFVGLTQPVTISFSNNVTLSSAKAAFGITPASAGTIAYSGTSPYEIPNQIVFTPSGTYQANTKYTVTISTAITDMYGVHMKTPYSFSFITRQN